MSTQKNKQRRANGEGSFVQRADGTWLFAIDLGKGPDGKRKRRYIEAKTRAALNRKLQDLKAQGGGSIRPRSPGTLSAWVEQWLEQEVKPNLSRNTYALYEGMWRVHVADTIGHVQLEKLDAAHVAALYAALREKGASPTIIARSKTAMHRAIAVATRRGLYHRVNPFGLVDRPPERPKETYVLTIDEARRFIDAAAADPLEALFVILLTAGLRVGEALALEWKDIDFERGRLSVRQAVTEIGPHLEIGPTKTRGSRRAVELGALAIGALRRRRAATQESTGSSLVFPTKTGTPMRRSNVARRHFAPILERAGISGLTMHGLRHAMASFGNDSGITAKVLADRLGHSTVGMTLNRYAHVLPTAQREAAEAIDELLRR